MVKQMVCVVCPKGCLLQLTEDPFTVSGNHCKRGEKYAWDEIHHPLRVISSTVAINNALFSRLPVVTKTAVLKDSWPMIMDIIGHIEVEAPIYYGDVIVENIGGSGADLIASRTMEKKV